MEIELKEAYSTPNADEVPLMSARGDYMSDSLVGTELEEAMDGSEKSRSELREFLMKRGHFGVFEHPQAFFAVEGMPVVVERQVTRHRHMSWDIQSMRYVEFDDAEAFVPDEFEDIDTPVVDSLAELYESDAEGCFDMYREYVEEGADPQQARYILPLGTAVNATFSANMRTLMHVIGIRNAGNVQPATQEFAEQLLAECKRWAPETFELYEDRVMNSAKLAP